MKKLGALLCVLLVTVMLSACQTFYDNTTKNSIQDEPMETTVFLQLKNLPIGSTVDAELISWLGTVRADAETADPDTTHILTAELRTTTTSDNTYTVDLTLTHVPDSVLEKTVRPFKIYYKHVIYNPIALLPASDVFTYVVGYTTTRRHSSANTDWITTDDDGNYVYLWTTSDSVEFTDVYANRPLYLIIVLGGAAVVGAVVYFVSRYYDCKNRKNHL